MKNPVTVYFDSFLNLITNRYMELLINICKQLKRHHVQYKTTIIKTDVSLLKTNFIDTHIYDYVSKYFKVGTQYDFMVHNKQVSVILYGYKQDYPVHVVSMILHVLLPYSKPSCTNHIKIHLFCSPHLKHMPVHGEVVGPKHLNSGYTYRCSPGSDIVIFRKEEWCKVLIHECFHYLGFDVEIDNPEYNTEVRKLFPIDTEVNIAESYCEVWARLLNCCIVSVIDKKPLKGLIEKERIHSCKQLHSLLKTMGLNYQDIHRPTPKFKEETNAFSYMILGGLLMCHYTYFLELFKKGNPFDYHHGNRYVQLIKRLYKEPLPFIKSTSSSSRMSCIELSISNT